MHIRLRWIALICLMGAMNLCLFFDQRERYQSAMTIAHKATEALERALTVAESLRADVVLLRTDVVDLRQQHHADSTAIAHYRMAPYITGLASATALRH